MAKDYADTHKHCTPDFCGGMGVCIVEPREETELERLERYVQGYQRECDEVQQILGKALGYPWYKDDQKNFPGATEADGVCIGDHVPASIAAEAARRIAELEAAWAELSKAKALGTRTERE